MNIKYTKGGKLYNMRNSLEFYLYNGFHTPDLIAVGWDELKDHLTLKHNYRGDITEETLEGLYDIITMFDTLEDAQKYGENVFNSIWINPTIENLADANESYGLDRLEYLNDFLG